jgi:hypothetical protein
MKKPIRSRPRVQPRESLSERNTGAEGWTMSVTKEAKGPEITVVEPFLVNEKTASTMLGVSPRTIWELERKDELRVKRIGRRKLYLVSSLKAYAEGRKEVE